MVIFDRRDREPINMYMYENFQKIFEIFKWKDFFSNCKLCFYDTL